MVFLIGPRHSRGAHDSRAPLEWRAPMRVVFRVGRGSPESWTLGPKALCHRHPTGPHHQWTRGLSWNFALARDGAQALAIGRIAQTHAELALDAVVPHAAVLLVEGARHGAHGRRDLLPP